MGSVHKEAEIYTGPCDHLRTRAHQKCVEVSRALGSFQRHEGFMQRTYVRNNGDDPGLTMRIHCKLFCGVAVNAPSASVFKPGIVGAECVMTFSLATRKLYSHEDILENSTSDRNF